MEARPSAMVFFSFFRRVRERYPPLSSSSSPSSSSSSSSSGFRDESAKGPRPRAEAERNETRLSLIRSTSSNPPVWYTRARTHAHTRHHTFVRAYTHVCTHIYVRKRIHAYSLSLAPALLRSVRFHPLVLPFSSLLASSSANGRAKSVDVLF